MILGSKELSENNLFPKKPVTGMKCKISGLIVGVVLWRIP